MVLLGKINQNNLLKGSIIFCEDIEIGNHFEYLMKNTVLMLWAAAAFEEESPKNQTIGQNMFHTRGS